MIGLDQTATIYTEHASTGLYSVVDRSDLACRLVHVDIGGAQSGGARAELAALRSMLFEPDYVMPETAQVEVSGIRWQPVAGTFGAFRGPSGTVEYRRCDVVRQS